MTGKDKKPIGSAVEKPAYGEKDQPEPIAPNRTDAEGITSNTQPGAAMGADPTRATIHTAPEITDPGYAARQMLENGEKLPHVLGSAIDVVREGKIYRIPAGTVVSDADLTDEEWDHAIGLDIVKIATVADVAADEQRKQQADTREKMLKLQRERHEEAGAKFKKGSDSKPPKGATLVADLEESKANQERLVAMRRETIAGSAHR